MRTRKVAPIRHLTGDETHYLESIGTNLIYKCKFTRGEMLDRYISASRDRDWSEVDGEKVLDYARRLAL